MARKHGWNGLHSYLEVVLRVLHDHPFVVGDHIEIPPPSPEAGEIAGDVFCHDNIILDVTKHYEIRAVGRRKEARTVRYSYHARYENGGDILRYDNAHADEGTGHGTTHHKHTFDGEHETITDMGELDWPHLSEVLAELRGLVWK